MSALAQGSGASSVSEPRVHLDDAKPAGGRAMRAVRKLGQALFAMTTANRMRIDAERLYAMSEAQLAQIGLTRDEIGTYLVDKHLSQR